MNYSSITQVWAEVFVGASNFLVYISTNITAKIIKSIRNSFIFC